MIKRPDGMVPAAGLSEHGLKRGWYSSGNRYRLWIAAFLLLALVLTVVSAGCTLSDPGDGLAAGKTSTPAAGSSTPLKTTSTAISATATTTGRPTTTSPTWQTTVNTPQPSRSGLPQEVEELPASTATVPRSYRWTYDGREWNWDLNIPQALYDHYRQLPRAPTADYSIYVTHPLDDAIVSQLASEIDAAANEKGYSAFETVNLALTFVQSLPYTVDSETTPDDEYPRYPVETLVDNGGDCEDSSILLASLLQAMDYGVVLLEFEDHMAVGVRGGEGLYGSYWEYEGDKYYYVETTGDRWTIGAIPDAYRDAGATVLPMVPVPVLVHSWKSSPSAGNTVNVEVTVENLGSADALDIHVFAGFDAGDSQVWNSTTSQTFDLGLSSRITVTMQLRVPPGEHTRMIVQIVDDGFSVDQSYSDWIDT